MALRIISKAWVVALIITMHPTPLAAQHHPIQSYLFEDCDRAQREFSNLDQEKRGGLVDYLTRVVGLSTQAPAAPEAFAVLPNGKPFEPLPAPLWQTTDAKRELRAKRCALELLTMAGPLAFKSLAPLATLYSEQVLSDEIAVGIEEATATIAEQAHKDGLTLSDEALAKLVPLLAREHPLVAQNLLHEYISLSLPHIIKFMAKAPEAEATRIPPFLRDIDQDGSRTMRVFVDLAGQLSSDDANRIASYLPFPSKEGAAPLVADFARLAATSTSGTSVSSLLGRACLLFGGILIDSPLATAVAQNATLIQEGAIPEEQQRCLVSSIPAVANNIVNLVSSSHEAEIRQGLGLLPDAIGVMSQEKISILFDKVKDLALQPKGQLRRSAIVALGYFPSRRSEVTTTLLQILKALLHSEDAPHTASLVDACFQAALKLNSDKELSRFASPALAAIKGGIHTPSLIAFASRVDSLEPGLAGLANSPRTDSAVVAIAALSGRKVLSKTAIPNLVEALRQPPIAASVEKLLTSHGPTAIPLLRRALLRSSSSQRLGILSLLQTFGASTKAERLEVANILSTAEQCQTVVARSSTVETILKASDVEDDLKSKLRTKVLSCLCASDTRDVEVIMSTAAPQLLVDISSVDLMLKDAKSCPNLEGILSHHAIDTSLSTTVRSHVLAQMLENGTRQTKLELLQSLSQDHPLAEQMLPSVRRVAAESSSDKELAFTSVLTLARLGDTQFEWNRFVKDTIETEESDQNLNRALEVIRALPAELVLNEVSAALDSDNSQRIAGACRIAATLGPLAIPVVSKIWNLREKRSPAVRYSATLALLEINPLTPELHTSLKAILVNRYYRIALGRPIRWRQSLAVADLDKASFGTVRSAHLERLALK